MIEIRNMTSNDWKDVARIYDMGIATGHATFETETPSWEAWNNSHIKECRLIATENNQIVGWAALSAVSSRCVYGGVAEVSLYVDTGCTGKGIGTKLLKSMIEESEQEGFWTLQSGIFPENIASLNIHKKLGFRIIGIKEKIGKMNGMWRDNTLLERRSKIVGIN